MAMIEKPRRTSKINTWKPKEYQKLVTCDGKLFVCYLDEILGRPNLRECNRFMIKKGSYENQLDIITKYTNFFMNWYDPDNELAVAYAKLKYATDKERLYTRENMDAFIDFIYEVMFTPTMVEKINQMVLDNYLDDIETETDEKKKYNKNEKKHLESLEFTNMHIKILLRISFGMKIMSPIMFHYFALNVIKIERDSDIIFRFYKRLFDIFGTGEDFCYCKRTGRMKTVNGEEVEDFITIEEHIPQSTIDILLDEALLYDTIDINRHRLYYEEDGIHYYQPTPINMYNKLYVYVKTKVGESNSNNAIIFGQREIFGVDIYNVINLFIKKVLISENIVKYKFNEHWDEKNKKYKESVVGFNKTIIKYQLNYFLKDQYQKNLTEVTNAKNSDGLSGSDKMAMNLSKIDEGAINLAEANVVFTINKISREYDIPITNDEIDFYIKNLNPSELQIQLVKSYFADAFGSYRDLQLLNRRQYFKLLLLLKKKLLIDLGYEEEETSTGEREVYSAALPYLLTGNLEDKMNTRVIRNNKFISKVQESSIYEALENNKYRLLQSIPNKGDIIKSLLSSFINTKFTYVVYEHPELLGQEIRYSEDKIADELLFFLKSIG